MVREGMEIKEYKGAPMKAMIQAQIRLAINGDSKAFDVLGKYGWGVKQEVDATVRQVTPIMQLDEADSAVSGNDSDQEG